MIIGLISYGKKKRQGTHKARDLYIGTYFSKTLNYAQTQCEIVYILSAKYGLVELDQTIHSYELKITQLKKQERKLWALHVLKQMKDKQLVEYDIKIYAGQPYYEPLVPYLPNATVMFEGLSMGYRMQAMT
jgi:hypothetical protein